MSKEIGRTVGGKRIAWLIALIAAFAVFAVFASGWRPAHAQETVPTDAIMASSTGFSGQITQLVDPSHLPQISSTEISGATIRSDILTVGVLITTEAANAPYALVDKPRRLVNLQDWMGGAYFAFFSSNKFPSWVFLGSVMSIATIMVLITRNRKGDLGGARFHGSMTRGHAQMHLAQVLGNAILRRCCWPAPRSYAVT